MAADFNILAEQDPTIKIVIGLIIAAFWIVSQVFGALTKKPDKRLPPPGGPKLQPPRKQPVLRSDGVAMPVPQMRRDQPRQQPRPPARITPPPIFTPATRASLAAKQQPDASTTRRPVTKPAANAQAPMRRNDMLTALLRPRNLQKAFMVTEILRPPVALRDEE